MKNLYSCLSVLLFVAIVGVFGFGTASADFATGSCVLDQPGAASKYTCTANEVPLTNANVTILDECEFPGDTALIQLKFDVDANTQRYDFGVWVSTDGDTAESGTCAVATLPMPNIEIGGTDTCGDVSKTNTIHSQVNLGTIQIDCIDSDSDGFVNIPMLIAWDQNEDNADCTDAFDALPGTTSKCNLNNNYPLPVPVPGQISFTKETLPDGATEDFSFTVLSGATQVDTAILSDGETWESGVDGPVFFAGTYTITESNIPAGWTLSNITCTNGDGGAEGTASPNGIVLNLGIGEEITCIFTNDRDPFCGDSSVDLGEECDDANLNDNDACKSDCTFNVCTDGVVETGVEECDDGDDINDDECSNACNLPQCGDLIIQSNEDCDDGGTANNDGCNSICIDESCGDGTKQTSEACDDGDNQNGDGCNEFCVLEFCGDGVVNDDGAEECDDFADGDIGDGCNAQCEFTYNGICGDVNTDIIYDFDNAGNSLTVNSDGLCDSGSVINFQFNTTTSTDHNWTWTCDGDGGVNADCSATEQFCGDNVQNNGEACDDGNTSNGDGCSSLCVVEYCGDNIVNNGEACDDGDEINNDECNNDCIVPIPGQCGLKDNATYYGDVTLTINSTELCNVGVVASFVGPDVNGGYSWSCIGTQGGDNDTCSADVNRCGDNSTNTNDGETCDDGELNGTPNKCNELCSGTTSPDCGNGTIENGEACDDGNNSNTDTCTNICTAAVCGDGFIQPGEVCDDQNTDNTDGCHICQPTTNGTCGDIDGNDIYDFNNGGDGLNEVSDSELCIVGEVAALTYSGGAHARTWSCLGDGGSNDTTCNAFEARCGDNIENGEEACDDGADGISTDGCNDLCEITTNGQCNVTYNDQSFYDADNGGDFLTNNPALCSVGLVGTFGFNSTTHKWEWTCLGSENGGSTDSCEAQELFCGDSITQENNGEECDDGAGRDGTDGCNDVCEITTNGVCGDLDTAILYGDVELDFYPAGFFCAGAEVIPTITGPDEDGVYTWTCLGSENGGSNDSCSLVVEYCGDGIINGDQGGFQGGDGDADFSALIQFQINQNLILQLTTETCDDGDLNGTPNHCNDSCDGTVSSTCGNGIVEFGEACDAGEGNSDSVADACRTDCTVPVCGDGVEDAGEECDDGNANNGDGCNVSCNEEEDGGGRTSTIPGDGDGDDDDTPDELLETGPEPEEPPLTSRPLVFSPQNPVAFQLPAMLAATGATAEDANRSMIWMMLIVASMLGLGCLAMSNFLDQE